MPPPEDAAKRILRLMVDNYGIKPGGSLITHNFLASFSEYPWKERDYDAGRRHAQMVGWVETIGNVIKLTGLGYEQIRGSVPKGM